MIFANSADVVNATEHDVSSSQVQNIHFHSYCCLTYIHIDIISNCNISAANFGYSTETQLFTGKQLGLGVLVGS